MSVLENTPDEPAKTLGRKSEEDQKQHFMLSAKMLKYKNLRNSEANFSNIRNGLAN